jgi:hypothetical protein
VPQAVCDGVIANVGGRLFIRATTLHTNLDNSEQLLLTQWRSTVSSCRDWQERPDIQQLLNYNTWEDLQDQIAQSHGDESSHPEFAMLAPGLTTLKTFLNSWLPKVDPRIDGSAIWGFVRLVVKIGPCEVLNLNSVGALTSG